MTTLRNVFFDFVLVPLALGLFWVGVACLAIHAVVIHGRTLSDVLKDIAND